MVAEVGHVLEEGLVVRESDIDVATVLGFGFPGFRGGLLRYARSQAPAAVRAELDSLVETCGERFAPGSSLHA
jgi:hypothetical protein